VTVGPPFYLRASGPLFGALTLLMGLAPLSAWGRSTWKTLGRAAWKPAIPALALPVILWIVGVHNWIALLGFFLVGFVILVTFFEIWRGSKSRQKMTSETLAKSMLNLVRNNRRRYGGYLVHLGMVIMAIGILGMEVFQTTTQKSLALGESLTLDGYTIRFDELSQFPYEDGRTITRAVVSLTQGNKQLGDLNPRYDLYPNGETVSIAGVHSSLASDIYVVLVNWENISGNQAPFKVYHNPLVAWLWIGSGVFILGFLLDNSGFKQSGVGKEIT
jgi:cytochrome c-type biogenesis protein CcmF